MIDKQKISYPGHPSTMIFTDIYGKPNTYALRIRPLRVKRNQRGEHDIRWQLKADPEKDYGFECVSYEADPEKVYERDSYEADPE